MIGGEESVLAFGTAVPLPAACFHLPWQSAVLPCMQGGVDSSCATTGLVAKENANKIEHNNTHSEQHVSRFPTRIANLGVHDYIDLFDGALAACRLPCPLDMFGSFV